MSKILAITVLALNLIGGTVLAAGKSVVCTLSGDNNYGMNQTIEIRRELDIQTGESTNDDGQAVIQYSLSECEDSTVIRISTQDVKAFKSGKRVSAEIEQEEPELLVKGNGYCQIQ